MSARATERRVLLVQPRASAEPAYPMALATTAAVLRAAGFSVFGADLCFERVSAVAARPAAWIGASVLPQNARQVRSLFSAARRHQPHVKTFVIGAWTTIAAERVLGETGADVAIVGDPERTVVAVVGGATGRSGTAVMHAGVCVEHGPSARVPLASLPLPDRSVFPVARYGHAMRALATPYAMMYTSRGCGLACGYCPVDAFHVGGVDARPAEQVVEEMTRLAIDHGVRSVHIEDDNPLRDRARVEAICDALIDRRLPLIFEFVNGVRPDHVDAALLAHLARAGCRRIVFSFEHIDPVGGLAVGYGWSRAGQVARDARAAGISVGGYFIVGLPGVTRAETLRSVSYALRLPLDHANFVPLWLTPGSPFADAPPADRLSSRLARAIAVAAHIPFFARGARAADLARDMVDDPVLGRTLAAKAWELARRGGPVPMRDMP